MHWQDRWLRVTSATIQQPPPFPCHSNPKIPRQKTAEKIPLPWRGAENSKNFRWGGLRKIAGFPASSGRWLSGVEATGHWKQQILQYSLNHPTKNSLNFRHPSMGGEFFRQSSDEGIWVTFTRKMMDSFEWWLSGAEATKKLRERALPEVQRF